MSALDDLFDGHYFTEDPHVYIPIDEAMDELSALRSEIERLKADLKESLRLLDCFVTVTYTVETILDANNLLKKLKGAK